MGQRRSSSCNHLVPFLLASGFTSSLVGNERFILSEGIFIEDEELTPVLLFIWNFILLLNANQKALRKIQKVVQVEEDIVDSITSQCTHLFQFLFQCLQILQMMDILPFSLHKLSQDILSSRHRLWCLFGSI